MEHTSYLPLWLLALPLIGFLLNGVLYPLAAGGIQKVPRTLAGITASVSIGGVFILGLVALGHLIQGDVIVTKAYEWLNVGVFKISLDLVLDRLSIVMVLIISGVGSLIHVYSMGYMEHEEGVGRFFAYLNLFCFSMLMLVLSDNLLFLFFGWEGVGLCSFLLIGYWYDQEANCAAAQKAFIVNRIGDVCFVMGLFILLWYFGTLSLSGMAGLVAAANPQVLQTACLLLFLGATGKSAQFPLFVWLPDAMAGPTPVSALIHAATMVTAGVYLIVRMSFMFSLSPDILFVIANVGCITVLLGGFIALQQNDIKKVLAYSTISQLGFMFIAVGVGAYKTAIFHLMTHAFFKALLFLGSGSVIHAMEGEQDMRKMGGLRYKLPKTYGTMMVGAGALMGLPLLSGFFSKDAILFAAHSLPGGAAYLWLGGLLGALLTGIYTTRLMKMTFFGTLRSTVVPHESKAIMTTPLLILAVLSAVAGFFSFPEGLGEILGIHVPAYLEHWLSPLLQAKEIGEFGFLGEIGATLVATGVSLLGLTIGLVIFAKSSDFPMGKKLLEGKFYVDELYGAFIVRPILRMGGALSALFEFVVQRVAEGLKLLAQSTASELRGIQTGDMQGSIVILVGAVVLFIAIFFIW